MATVDLTRLTPQNRAAIRDRVTAWTVEGRFRAVLDENGLLILGPASP